jgi:hypothetical protein
MSLRSRSFCTAGKQAIRDRCFVTIPVVGGAIQNDLTTAEGRPFRGCSSRGFGDILLASCLQRLE